MSAIVACPHCGKKNRVRPSAQGVPRCGNCHNALPWIVDADRNSFDEEIAASVPVVVDFWAPWCGPCRMIAPSLESLSRKHAGRLKVVRLNVDQAPDLSARHGVQGIPLLVLFQNGEERDRLVGAVPERQIEAWIEPHLPATASPA